MATTISRTWYNTLQDDSGSATDGTVIDKADFNEILNAIDAMFAGAIVTGGSLTIAGALAGATTGTFSGAVSMAALTATRGTLSTGTITTSQPVITGTQTWNAGAVTFTGISLNVTDTASAAASLLLDLQIGGASKFKVQKDGTTTLAAGLVATTGAFSSTLSVTGASTLAALSATTGAFSSTLAVTGVTTLTGSVGIGGISPVYPLEVGKAINGGEVVKFNNSDATSPYGMLVTYSGATPNNTTNWFFKGADNTADRVVLRSNGGIANYSANDVNLSDLGAKNIIGPAPSQRTKIRALKFYRGRYKDSTRGHDDLMWGAQDILAIDPQWTDVWQEEERDKAGAVVRPRLLGTRDHVIFMASVAVVAEHDALIDALAARVAALEAR